MEKKQKSDDHDDARPDRLSDLPDSLILEILSFLEMRDVVQTALLSKRWKGLWITIPCLYFDETKKRADRSWNFIKRALKLWNGTQILKFKMIFGREMLNPLSDDMNFWVELATARKVEELYLHSRPPSLYDMRTGNRGPEMNILYRPPECLYSCSSISKLTLIGCDLDLRQKVRWDRLKSFTFYVSYIDDDNLISHVVSGAPQLENFELYLLQNCGKVSIRSSSLKKLSIFKKLDWKSRRKYESMTIWAPNLEALEFSGTAYSECLLTDVSSLTEVTVYFTGSSERVESTLQQILPIIQHVGAIKLSANCIKVMMGVIQYVGAFKIADCIKVMRGVMKGISLNAKVVTVSVTPIELEPKRIVHRLGFFPMVKMLIIDLNAASPNNQDIGEPVKSDAYIHKALLQLTRVEIIWYSYETSMFQFIEFLLKRATMLEKIVIKKGKAVNSKDMLLAAKKVMSLQRSFPTVYLIDS